MINLKAELWQFIWSCWSCFSDDEDDTAELLAELQRIKKERAQEEARKVRFSFEWCTVWCCLVSPSERLSKISTLYIQLWGCTPALPSGPWHLMFALGQLGNLSVFVKIICWATWISRVQSNGLGFLHKYFFRAQPCLWYITWFNDL